MDNLVTFKKKADSIESADVITFKTDLAMFIRYIEKINIADSIRAVANVEPGLQTIMNNYLTEMVCSILGYLKKVHETPYRNIGFIPASVYDAVYDYLEYSEDPEHFSMNYRLESSTWEYDFCITTLSEKVNIISNIGLFGDAAVQRLGYTATLATFNNGLSFVDTQTIPAAYDDFVFQFYKLTPQTVVKEEPYAIDHQMDHSEFTKQYLMDIILATEFLILPHDILSIEAVHPLLEQNTSFSPMYDLYIPFYLPLSQLDRYITMTLRSAQYTYELYYNGQEWTIDQKEEREDYQFHQAIINALHSIDFKNKDWEFSVAGERCLFTHDFKYAEQDYIICWTRCLTDEELSVEVRIYDSAGNPQRFEFSQFVLLSRSVVEQLDAKSSKMNDLLTSLGFGSYD